MEVGEIFTYKLDIAYVHPGEYFCTFGLYSEEQKKVFLTTQIIEFHIQTH